MLYISNMKTTFCVEMCAKMGSSVVQTSPLVEANDAHQAEALAHKKADAMGFSRTERRVFRVRPVHSLNEGIILNLSASR